MWEDDIYVAGFFDGEGCIHINRYKNKKNGRDRHSLVCKVSVCNQEVLKHMRSLYGGCLYPDAPHHISNRYGALWVWGCWSDTAKSFLEKILPYLHIKRDEAELGIEFQSLRLKGYRAGKKRKSDKEYELDDWYYSTMRELKFKGARDGTVGKDSDER